MKDQVPFELVEEILARLPVKNLVRFRSVSKTWKALMNDSTFIYKHMNHGRTKLMALCNDGFYSLANNGDQIVDSQPLVLPSEIPSTNWICTIVHCNGILCVALKNESLALWNPSLAEFKIISTHNSFKRFDNLGFGYDRSTGDYKVITFPRTIDSRSRFRIFSLNSGSWRDSRCFAPCNRYIRRSGGTLLKENLFWQGLRSIFCFNYVAETYEELTLPSCWTDQADVRLGVMNGKVCMVGHYIKKQKIKIMALDEMGKDTSRWNDKVTISTINIPTWIGRPLAVCLLDSRKDAKVLVRYRGFTRKNKYHCWASGEGKRVFLYDEEKQVFRQIRTGRSLARFYLMFEYSESLVSVKGCQKKISDFL